MEIGVQVVGDYDHLVKIANITEASAAVALALADHYLYGSEPEQYAAPAYDSLFQTAALARDTKDLELVMLVSPITFRHPAVYAKGAITIDELSGGRFTLGLGTGWHDDEHLYHGIDYPDRSTRFAQLAEAFAYVHRYFDEPESGFEGEFYRFTGFDSHPKARREGRRLLIGGSGAIKTPTLAGKHADEFNLYHHDPVGIAERVEVMRQAAHDAGRDPDAILISTCLPMIGGDSESEIAAVAAGLAKRSNSDPEELLARYRENPGIQIGPWQQHREWLARMHEAGIERTYLQLAAGVDWHLERALTELA